ncbi:hypothetical protein PG996_014389 [Apiospora saccharicola]|uniref:Uncharacterized protein n=1 Tax=Apiospora saccharicola TaxID=335842 RepID=A0ABR1TK73_9PEZI
MPNQNDQGYKITSSGVNSQGNHYCHRDYGDAVPNRNNYHYSNRDGGYYYKNPNGSTYYNDGRGKSTYTAPNGRRYISVREDHVGDTDQKADSASQASGDASGHRSGSCDTANSYPEENSQALGAPYEVAKYYDVQQFGSIQQGYLDAYDHNVSWGFRQEQENDDYTEAGYDEQDIASAEDDRAGDGYKGYNGHDGHNGHDGYDNYGDDGHGGYGDNGYGDDGYDDYGGDDYYIDDNDGYY